MEDRRIRPLDGLVFRWRRAWCGCVSHREGHDEVGLFFWMRRAFNDEGDQRGAGGWLTGWAVAGWRTQRRWFGCCISDVITTMGRGLLAGTQVPQHYNRNANPKSVDSPERAHAFVILRLQRPESLLLLLGEAFFAQGNRRFVRFDAQTRLRLQTPGIDRPPRARVRLDA